MRLIILFIWRVWFYILASIPIIFLFPFLAISAIHPKGYNFIFWCARNIWSPFILLFSGFYTKVDYEEELPVGESFILIANHTSYIDPFVMFQVSKNPFVFVGKKELVKIPIFGYIYRRAAVMVDRSSKKSRWGVYDRVDKQLSLGYSICIFPEVKYTDDTIFLNDFKRGAFKIAIDHQIPIIPMCFLDCKRKFPWYPRFGYPGQLRVKILKKMQPPKNISKLNDFKEQVWGIIFNELKKDPLKIHEKAVGKETIIKTNQLN
jgi:1-acyl-sn-glycerol-3-phosphate acyltransferase